MKILCKTCISLAICINEITVVETTDYCTMNATKVLKRCTYLDNVIMTSRYKKYHKIKQFLIKQRQMR